MHPGGGSQKKAPPVRAGLNPGGTSEGPSLHRTQIRIWSTYFLFDGYLTGAMRLNAVSSQTGGFNIQIYSNGNLVVGTSRRV